MRTGSAMALGAPLALAARSSSAQELDARLLEGWHWASARALDVFESSDGEHWSRLPAGLPTDPMGKIHIEMAPASARTGPQHY